MTTHDQITQVIKLITPKNGEFTAYECVNFTGEFIQVIDEDIMVMIPFSTETPFMAAADDIIDMLSVFGASFKPRATETEIEVTAGNRSARIPLEHEQMPDRTHITGADFEHITEIEPAHVEQMGIGLNFISRDDLAIMRRIFLRDGKIYASDGFSMYFDNRPISGQTGSEDISLSKKSVQIMKTIGGQWNVCRAECSKVSGSKNSSYLRIRNDDGISIFDRIPDGDAPMFSGVIPKQEDLVHLLECSNLELSHIIKQGSRFSGVTKRMTLICSPSSVTVEFWNDDRDFRTQLKIAECSSEITISMSSDMVQRILKHTHEKLVIQMATPRSAVIINDCFLLMPAYDNFE